MSRTTGTGVAPVAARSPGHAPKQALLNRGCAVVLVRSTVRPRPRDRAARDEPNVWRRPRVRAARLTALSQGGMPPGTGGAAG
ncbi:hypothetical protein, partial [Streptomyces sp. NPDC058964]|uniref:hypothetical protein n=1 Tax=Streptomyces sp. NPDC058964 TaxID=3346681 RepID=UPI0036C1BB2E